MLLQTNSYIVPKDKRAEHQRLVRRFRQTLARLGCDHFEVYEQVGSNWGSGETTGRYVHIMRFRDRKHQLGVQAAERNDAAAQALINEFCELINFPYQQQQGLFAVGFYQSVLPVAPLRPTAAPADDDAAAGASPELVTEGAMDNASADTAELAVDGTNVVEPVDAAGDDLSADATGAEPAEDDHVDLGDDDDAPSGQPTNRRNT